LFKLIVGLGNPGKKYENTRHNIGFKVLDRFCCIHNIQLNTSGFNGIFHKGTLFEKKIIILKPMTYMNLSGNSVSSVVGMYKIELKDVLIVYDDMDLPLGKMRIRKKGTAGGHNGMKSIISSLGNNINIPRLRIGIGRTEENNSINHVLSNFSKEENKILDDVIAKSCLSIEDIIKYEDYSRVMNEYNQN
jgi:PTH1 family peptidyl-tRNA hydrolase